MTKKKSVERRKQKRMRVKSGAFVGVGPHFNQVGPLLDISKDGLAFCYTARKKQPNGLSLDIFLTDGDFYLSYVPFKAVFDTENQLSRLEHIIQNHRISEMGVS
jgi:hypothetical protein